MANPRNQKNKNALNLFLRNYFPALIAAALVLFLGLAYFFFLGPKFSAAQASIRANLDSEQRLYLNSLKKLASYRSIEELYRKIDAKDLQRFNGVLPDNYVPERLFGEIEEMVAQGGWLIGSLTISAPGEDRAGDTVEGEVAAPDLVSAGQNLGLYNINLSIASIDYAGLKKLLKIFENNLRLFDVTTVNFSPGDDSAEIVLSTYYYKIAP
ncbi:MAG: hypothetical protein WC456_00765 [Patescibacteria group bacterium]